MPSKNKTGKLQKSGKVQKKVEKTELTIATLEPLAKTAGKTKAPAAVPPESSEDENIEGHNADSPEDSDEDILNDEAEGMSEGDDVEDDVHEYSSGDDEGADVDEKSMERLMKLLGEDGLDDVARAELQALVADEDITDEEEDESASEGQEEGEDEDENTAEAEEAEEAKDRVSSNEEASEAEEEQEVLLEDADSVDEDAVPRQKVEIDNKIALERIRDTIKLDSSIPWTETLTLTYPETIDVDVNDDLNRELAFYKQALHGVRTAKSLAANHGLPFTRPSDYFAEMVKSDAHMERIRQRLLDESASIKRGEEKRKEREGKKFGKQVQLEKQKERERSKKEMEERLKGLKRKRKGALDNQEDDGGFDVAVEDAISDRPSKRARGVEAGGKKLNRVARDQKFGFGGVGRRSKQNTKSSTDNFDALGADRPGRGGKGGRGGAKGGAKRPGKSRRLAARSRS